MFSRGDSGARKQDAIVNVFGAPDLSNRHAVSALR
jgi:hypothetical protein